MESQNLLTPVSVDDIPLIQQIAQTTWPVVFGDILEDQQIQYMLDWMYDTEELRKQIEGLQYRYFFIGQKAGFAAIEHHYQHSNDTKIHKLYILPQFQGQGLGKKAMEQFGKLAVSAGDTALILNVNKNNPATLFYEKYGFARWKSETIDIGRGYVMDDYVYRVVVRG